MNKTRPTRIQADFIVVEPGRILPQAQLVVCDQRITEVVEHSQAKPDLWLHGQTLLPGLINSHTHLEFSDLAQPFQASGSFPEWISTVVQHRRRLAQAHSNDELRQQRQTNLLRGMIESAHSGTSVLVDIATEPWQPQQAVEFFHANRIDKELDKAFNQALDSRENQNEANETFADSTLADKTLANIALPTIIGLSEIIGLDEARFSQTMRWAESMIEALDNSELGDCVLSVGYSPHAPYSLQHPESLQQLQRLDRSLPVAMHVAESLEELEWAEHGSGSFRDVYQRIGMPIDAPRMQVDEAIELLAQFERPLLIHGNYLKEHQLDRIARSQIAIVYCPRTHQHFQHQPYPLDRILERRIPLLLGTDSRASNPDLNVWEECRQAKAAHPNWKADEIFAAVTTHPARHLGVQGDYGSLCVGRKLPINAIPTPANANAETLLNQLLSLSHPAPKPLRTRTQS